MTAVPRAEYQHCHAVVTAVVVPAVSLLFCSVPHRLGHGRDTCFFWLGGGGPCAARARVRLRVVQEISSTSTHTHEGTVCFEESKLTVRERLLALFTVYSPNALMTIDALLDEYKGRERALFRMLGRKFQITTDQALSIGTVCTCLRLWRVWFG